MHSFENNIVVGARSSPLSKVQVDEVLDELRTHHPKISFTPVWIETSGDTDKHTSLITLEKTDFFTKEIDQALSTNTVRISIHSAKDLPDPLDDALAVVAITKGLDPSDVLVTRKETSLEALAPDARIATSSLRRLQEIKKLLPNAEIVDIRGNIGERLEKLTSGFVDAIVMAKAALIRLKLDMLPQIPLTENSAPFQGKLAVVARKDDHEMNALFSCMDIRPRMLYLGLEAPKIIDKRVMHHPLIQTKIRNNHELSCLHKDFLTCSHILLTSKSASRYFFDTWGAFPEVFKKTYIAVGRQTANALKGFGVERLEICQDESQEGIISHIKETHKTHYHYFWPHSNVSRRLLPEFLKASNISFSECVLYDTNSKMPKSPLCFDAIDEIFFSSPSTVDAFFSFYGALPKEKKVLTQGAVTQSYLNNLIAAQNP